MAEPEIKAAGLASWMAATRAVAGEAAFARFVAALSPPVRALVEHPPLPVTWLPATPERELHEQSIAILFGGDVERLVDVGREQFRQDLRGLYRIFVRVASPRFVAERAASIYQTYTRNNGAMRLSDAGDRWVELTLDGVVTASPAFYALRRGNVLGAIDATGARGARVDVVGGGGRDPRCVLRARWD